MYKPLFRFVTRHRRLVPEFVRSIGHTPLIEIPLEMGSYLLEIHKEGHEVVRYPVFIERGQHWRGVRPGSSRPFAIALPMHGALGSSACYVPAGWFYAGGDPDAHDSWPRRRFWADAFVMQRFPVTNREYIAFLDDLVAQGREGDALKHAPRERGGTVGELGAMIYGRDDRGRFELRPDADGDMWLDDEPVAMISWHNASAYADWRAERDGLSWRLPMEQEFEKAARGVDGRFFPWGDDLDPSRCCMRDSHQNQTLPSVIESYPVDVSVYGVRGLGGNMRDWCLDVYQPEVPNDALVSCIHAADMVADRVYRGGTWYGAEAYCRAAARMRNAPLARLDAVTLRLLRPYP